MLTNMEYKKIMCKSCKFNLDCEQCEFENITRVNDEFGIETTKCQAYESINYKRTEGTLVLLHNDEGEIIERMFVDAEKISVLDVYQKFIESETLEPFELFFNREMQEFGYIVLFDIDLEPQEKNPCNYKNVCNLYL